MLTLQKHVIGRLYGWSWINIDYDVPREQHQHDDIRSWTLGSVFARHVLSSALSQAKGIGGLKRLGFPRHLCDQTFHSLSTECANLSGRAAEKVDPFCPYGNEKD